MPWRGAAIALSALLVVAPVSSAPAQDSASPQVLEEAANEVVAAPPVLSDGPVAAPRAGAAGVAVATGQGAVGVGGSTRPLTVRRRRLVSLRDVFGEDFESTAGLEQPLEGLFSARLPAFLAPDSALLERANRGQKAGDSSGYSLGGNLRASLDYSRARAFPMAPSQALREQGYLDLSTGKDRDVVGLMMAWSWQNSTVDLGYRLESSRLGPYGEGRTLSSLVTGQGIDHALTIGITRRWGADDGKN